MQQTENAAPANREAVVSEMMDAGEAAPAAQPSALRDFLKRGWIVSPTWDAFWFLGGISLLPLPFFLSGAFGKSSMAVGIVYGSLNFLLVTSHQISPVYGAWALPGLRREMLKHKARYIYAPLAILLIPALVGGAAAFTSDAVRGWLSLIHPWNLIFLAAFLGDFQHFGGQYFGMLSLYRKTSGQKAPLDRRVDYLYAMTLTFVFSPLTLYSQKEALGPLLQMLPAAPAGFGSGVVAASLAMLAAMLLFELRKPETSLPRLLFILGMGLAPTTMNYDFRLFAIVYGVWHWLAAIGLVGRVVSKSEKARNVELTSRWQRIRASFGFKCAIMFGLGLPIWLPTIGAEKLFGLDDLDNFMGGAKVVPLGLGLLAGLVVGVGLCHILYDRAFYGFRHAEIREHVAPHLFS